MEQTVSESGLTRRELLKRGAALGGAVVWATPIVQAVGMQSALAQVPSPACDSRVCANVLVNDVVVGSWFCEPTTAEDGACFCCCAGLDEFCPSCNKACTQVEITCDGFLAGVSCADRGF